MSRTFDTSKYFRSGELTVIMDGGAGSSGKGKLGAFVTKHADNWQFACNTFAPQAGHWVVEDDGSRYFYQTFNSCASYIDKYEKLYSGPGACLELSAFWREIEENKIPHAKIGISPLTSILQQIDGDYEKGLADIDGDCLSGPQDGGHLAQTGTTAHGCGANRARRVLRHPKALFACDIPELKEFICDVPGEIMGRLDRGQAGLLEIAQGFQLSNFLPEFYPHCTSRNCTVAAGLDDLMVPPKYAGQVILNFRTFPIRINNNKYIEVGTGRHLTWAEKEALEAEHSKAWHANNPPGTEPWNCQGPELYVRTIQGDSGPGYDDQDEWEWDELTRASGSPTPIMEMTSVTKLPRRVFTFSRKNVEHAMRHNDTGRGLHLALNFTNYVDYGMTGKRGQLLESPSDRLEGWLDRNFGHPGSDLRNRLKFFGTGARTDDMIVC